ASMNPMERVSNSPKSSVGLLACILLFVLPLHAIQVPAATTIDVRLTTKISTQTAKVKDPVEAVVIAPIAINGECVIPSGAKIRDTIDKVPASTKADERSTLSFAFTELEIDGVKHPFTARVGSVDNARETINDEGLINGIVASETISGRIDAGINKLA